MLLKIGEFSRYAQVSARSLRHYDEIGLLKPVHIDPESGYRLYSLDQLPRIHYIRALRHVDLSLEQIREILLTQADHETLRRMLDERRQHLLASIQGHVAQLLQVEHQLKVLDSENTNPLYPIVIKELPEKPAISYRRKLTTDDGNLSGLFYRMIDALTRKGYKNDDAIGLFHGHPFLNGQDAEFEWAVTLTEPASDLQALRLDDNTIATCSILPHVPQAASIILEGSMAQKCFAERFFTTWAKHNQYQLVGPIREHYVRIIDGDPMHPGNLMEIHFPIQKT